MQAIPKNKSAIENVESMANWMDSRFTIPGTKIKFGFDALIGLIPGAGDFTTLFISGYMVTILAKNGASGFVLARMAQFSADMLQSRRADALAPAAAWQDELGRSVEHFEAAQSVIAAHGQLTAQGASLMAEAADGVRACKTILQAA